MTTGKTEEDYQLPSKPYQDAKREAIIRAARIIVNCYRWQGEGRKQYLDSALEKLAEAVDRFEEKRVETADVTVPLTGVSATATAGSVGVVQSYDPAHDEDV